MDDAIKAAQNGDETAEVDYEAIENAIYEENSEAIDEIYALED